MEKRDIERHVGYHIGIAAHFIQNRYNEKLAEVDLTVAQARALYLLVEHGPQIQVELQNRLYIKGSTMNGLIETMEKKGFIERRASSSDKRSKVIHLTDKGYEIDQIFWKKLTLLEDELLEGFMEEEKALLIVWLKRLKENLCVKESKATGEGGE
ncbi:MarR family winged helix-turn-helix transcriptional regulator [Halalkalibacter sp. APA_J-10(15)]|uniref:MarR family winged helix-turn-helix transcriptional regulator n=1 Tax=Halalkalibacter sp. APA_J-10(15) TaxID=2933805 RepID=UPI001FF5614A|nr:MarR family transcriptional regulator [Halalkalibacter sp. APA_J-10(15)]MCK0469924.1 MarR family transcriptional regulator [Halalkalibacter sp. APA_J-10(15)]